MKEEKESFRYPAITEYKNSSPVKYLWILGGFIAVLIVSVTLFIIFKI